MMCLSLTSLLASAACVCYIRTCRLITAVWRFRAAFHYYAGCIHIGKCKVSVRCLSVCLCYFTSGLLLANEK